MAEPRDKASEYRKEAADCIEVAEQMSLREDCKRMMERAQAWLTRAQEEEGKTPEC